MTKARNDDAGTFPAIGAKRREPSSMAELLDPLDSNNALYARPSATVEQRIELAQFSDAQLAKLFTTRLHRIAGRLMGAGTLSLASFERNAMASDLELLAEEIEERLGR
jgi:hypothetical protein